ncbi:protein YgfX [Paraglaciecola aestuariivivens]
MSKYRVDLQPSRLLIVFQSIFYLILLLSIFSWHKQAIPGQFLLQLVLVLIISFFLLKKFYLEYKQGSKSIVFSQQGDWLESSEGQQISYWITSKSRVTSLVLFVHVESALDKKLNKWLLVFRDQLPERDFRRMCRAIFYQQQLSHSA